MTIEELQAKLADMTAAHDAAQASISKLEAKNKELQDEKQAAKSAAEQAREAAEAAAEEKARTSKDLDALEATLTKKFQKMTEAEKARADAASAQLHTLLVERGIDDALSTANVATPLRKAAAALLKTEHRVEIADGAATVNGTPLAEFVASWAKTDGAHFIAAPVNSGGGSTGSTTGATATFTKENFASKTTEFMALAKTDKAQAIAIAQSLGLNDVAQALNE